MARAQTTWIVFLYTDSYAVLHITEYIVPNYSVLPSDGRRPRQSGVSLTMVRQGNDRVE